MPIREWHWWTYGKNKKGEMTILGGFKTEDRAQEENLSAFDGNGECVYLPTTQQDKAKATTLIKYKLYKQTHNLEDSIRPVKHKKNDKQSEIEAEAEALDLD